MKIDAPRSFASTTKGLQMKTWIFPLALLLGISGAATAQSGDTLAKARASGSITLGVRDSSVPLSYLVGNAHMGLHVELCENFAKKVVPGAKIKYMSVTSQNRIPLLQNGTIDLECGSTTNNAARQQQVAFAHTTYVTEARYAVKKASGITSIEQLNGKTVSTGTGTTIVQKLRKLETDQKMNFNVVLAKDHAEGFLLLESGRVDAYAMDDNTLAGVISTLRNPADYTIVGKSLGTEPLAIMIRKDDPALKSAIDGYLAQLMASGEMQRLYDKWFMSPVPPRNVSINIPAGAALRAAYQSPNDRPAEAYEAR